MTIKLKKRQEKKYHKHKKVRKTNKLTLSKKNRKKTPNTENEPKTEGASIFIRMMCTTVIDNKASNSFDNLSSYPTNNHHSSGDVYRRDGKGSGYTVLVFHQQTNQTNSTWPSLHKQVNQYWQRLCGHWPQNKKIMEFCVTADMKNTSMTQNCCIGVKITCNTA